MLKGNLTANCSIKKVYWKPKIKSYGYKVADFYDKKMPKIGSNHTYLAVINSDSTHKESIICNCFQNIENTLKKINDYYWWFRNSFWWFWWNNTLKINMRIIGFFLWEQF